LDTQSRRLKAEAMVERAVQRAVIGFLTAHPGGMAPLNDNHELRIPASARPWDSALSIVSNARSRRA
jgi:hypothetical protein